MTLVNLECQTLIVLAEKTPIYIFFQSEPPFFKILGPPLHTETV